jgi:dodecin
MSRRRRVRRAILDAGRQQMDEHIYRVIQIVGSSEKSIDDAIHVAIARASKTLRELRWFEVVETRGHIESGKVHHFQVTLKVGFTLDGD